VSTPNILARKSEEGPLPYCETRAKLKGNNQPGPLVSPHLSIPWVFEFILCPESTMHIKYINNMCMPVYRKEWENTNNEIS
jgi:hypothetical protein